MTQILRYIELAQESAYPDEDTYVPAVAGSGVYLNIASTSLDVPGETDIPVDSAFGRAAQEVEPGFYAPSGSISYAAVLDTITHFLKGVLGGYAFTAGTTGVFEVQTLTLTAADADGGAYSFALPDAGGVSRTYNLVAAAGATAAALATQIDAVAVEGWDSTASAAAVAFTRRVKGPNVGLGTFTPGASGATGSFAQTTAGAAATPSTHEFWGSDARDLPSWLVRVGKDNFEHGFQGCVMESIEIAVEDALANLSTELNAQKDFKAPGGIQSKTTVQAALPKGRKIPFHKVFLTIDGVLQKRKAKNLTWSVSNGTDVEGGRYLGSRHPGRISANERSSSASTELDFSDLSAIEKLWGGVNGPSAQGGAEFPCQFEYHAGSDPADPNAAKTNLKMIVKLPRANYTSVETQPSGREEMTQPVSIGARTGTITLLDGTTTVESDIYVRVQNWKGMVLPV